MRTPILVPLFLLVALAISPACRADRRFDLVADWRSLSGDWGDRSRSEWRISLGVFDQRWHATEVQLFRRGLQYERFIAAWLASDTREPRVLVSPSFPDEASARRALRRYQRVVPDAFVRRFQVWSNETPL